jgi:hypothetical protein
MNPHLGGGQQPGGGGVPLSPGQLPDVSPNAVRVIQKDVQGKQEIRSQCQSRIWIRHTFSKHEISLFFPCLSWVIFAFLVQGPDPKH